LSSSAESALSFALTIAQMVSNSPDGTRLETIALCSNMFMKPPKEMLKMSGSPGASSVSE